MCASLQSIMYATVDGAVAGLKYARYMAPGKEAPHMQIRFTACYKENCNQLFKACESFLKLAVWEDSRWSAEPMKLVQARSNATDLQKLRRCMDNGTSDSFNLILRLGGWEQVTFCWLGLGDGCPTSQPVQPAFQLTICPTVT